MDWMVSFMNDLISITGQRFSARLWRDGAREREAGSHQWEACLISLDGLKRGWKVICQCPEMDCIWTGVKTVGAIETCGDMMTFVYGFQLWRQSNMDDVVKSNEKQKKNSNQQLQQQQQQPQHHQPTPSTTATMWIFHPSPSRCEWHEYMKPLFIQL